MSAAREVGRAPMSGARCASCGRVIRRGELVVLDGEQITHRDCPAPERAESERLAARKRQWAEQLERMD